MGKTMKQLLIVVIAVSAFMVVLLCAILPSTPKKRYGYGTEFSHNSHAVFQRTNRRLNSSVGLIVPLPIRTKTPNISVTIKPEDGKSIPSINPHLNGKSAGEKSIPTINPQLNAKSAGEISNTSINPHLNATFSATERFVRLYENLNLTGPTVSPIVAHVQWMQDLSHANICNTTDPFILAMVFSAIPNTKERQRIRKTWGSRGLYKYTKIRAIFVLGATTNDTLQKNIEIEIEEHQDIIQYNYIDAYRNLTYKTLSWMSWVREHCLDVPWIAKIDDDIIVNPFNLNKYLVQQFQKNPAPNTIHGRLRVKNKPMRGGKWVVTKEEYPPERYPPFVLGPAYIMGRNAIEKLLEYAPFTPFLWLEDVYVTGLVARAAGVTHTQAEKVLYTKKLTRKLYNGPVAFYIGASERSKRTSWAYIMKYGPKN